MSEPIKRYQSLECGPVEGGVFVLYEDYRELEAEKVRMNAEFIRAMLFSCDKHAEQIKSIDFSEFIKRIKGYGCPLCHRDSVLVERRRCRQEEVDRLKHALEQAMQEFNWMVNKERYFTFETLMGCSERCAEAIAAVEQIQERLP